MQRYFVSGEDDFVFDQEQLFHIKKVMRSRVGDQIELVTDKKVYVVEIKKLEPFEVSIIKEEKIKNNVNKVTLFYCLPKGDKIDLVLQKATELGVEEIVLVRSKRCVTKYKDADFEKKLPRFRKIVLEASEQSKRDSIPEISKIIDFKDIAKYKFDLSLIAYEKTGVDLKLKLPELKDPRIAVLIGTEGGFEKEEVEYAKQCGFLEVSLGSRILRSETAVFYALSVIDYLLGGQS